MIVFTITQGSVFLSWTSFKLVLIDPAVFTGCLALAFLVPLATGTFDLSIGANMSMALVISATLSSEDTMPDIAAMFIALVACGGRRFHQRVLRRRLRVNSFIATLGMSQVITAFVLKTSSQSINDAFTDGYREHRPSRGVRHPAVHVLPRDPGDHRVVRVRTHTRRPAHVRHRRQPRSGAPRRLRTDRLIWGSLVASGMIAGFAGIIYGWKVGNYAQTVGPGYLFPAIAAVFFGASQLKGRPNVWGTLSRCTPSPGASRDCSSRSRRTCVDRAAVPGRVAARRGVAGQSPGCGQGAQEQGSCRGGASRTGSDDRRLARSR